MTHVVTQHTPTRVESDGKGFTDFAKRYLIKYTDLDGSLNYAVPVDADMTVLGVRARIKTAFVGLTTSTIQVGDANDADGYLVDANLDLETLGAFYSSQGGANAYGQGRHYAAVNRIIVDIGAASGTLTAGELVLEVLYAGYGNGPQKGEIANWS